jgi:hypothetical protein
LLSKYVGVSSITDNIGVAEPMPEHVLEWLARADVVRVEEDVETTPAQQIVELDSRIARLHPSVAHKHPALAPEQADTFQERHGQL